MKKISEILVLTIFLFSLTSLASAKTFEVEKVVKKGAVSKTVACTMEAKMCPDGSFVGRVGPNCEFAPCPDDVDSKEATQGITVPKNDETKATILEPSVKPGEDSKGSGVVRYLGPPIKVGDKEGKDRVCTMEFDPVCGTVDTGVRCITEPCPSSVRKTFSNRCLANLAGAKEIEEGVCDKKTYDFGEGFDGRDGIKRGVSEGVEVTQELLLEIKEAKSEEERRAVFYGEDYTAEVVEENSNAADVPVVVEGDSNPESEKEAATSSVEEKRRRGIEKKSKEIFSKFDYFSNKLNEIISKLEKKISKMENFELNDSFKTAKKLLEKSSENKVLAWLEFNSLVRVKDREEAMAKIEKTEELLEESKNNLKASFDLLKDVLLYLKK